MTTKATRRDAPKSGHNPSRATMPPATALPPGVRYVTISVPVVESFAVDSAGNVNDGGLGHLELRLGRGPAQGMHRVLLALQRMAESADGSVPAGALPEWKRRVSGSDVARYLFAKVEAAVDG